MQGPGRITKGATLGSDVQTDGDTTPSLETIRSQRANLRDAMNQLERTVARPAPGRVDDWKHTVHDALVDLSAAFERHIAVTEGDNGFLADVAEHSPRLINAIKRICAEHERISDELTASMRGVRKLGPTSDVDAIDAAREHLNSLVADLVRHRQHGADLIYEAHAVDIGGSD